LEVIVVDDGSTDDTSALVEAAAAADPRIRGLSQSRAGAAAARNAGLEVARGSLIAPLDADDLWHPDNLRLQVAALLAAGPDVAVSYAWHVLIDSGSRVVGFRPMPRIHRRREAFDYFLTGNFLGCGSVTLLRREAVVACGGYDTRLRQEGYQNCEDLTLYLALSERFDFVQVPRFLVGYRRHFGGKSYRQPKGMRESRIRMLHYVAQRNPEAASTILAVGQDWATASGFLHLCRERRWRDGWRTLTADLQDRPLATWPRLARAAIRVLWRLFRLRVSAVACGWTRHGRPGSGFDQLCVRSTALGVGLLQAVAR
jgi:hypothetical protein